MTRNRTFVNSCRHLINSASVLATENRNLETAPNRGGTAYITALPTLQPFFMRIAFNCQIPLPMTMRSLPCSSQRIGVKGHTSETCMHEMCKIPRLPRSASRSWHRLIELLIEGNVVHRGTAAPLAAAVSETLGCA